MDRDLDKAIGTAYSGTRPPTLCHYTRAAGLLGILKQRLIRANEATDQDDCDELKHADGLIVKVSQRFARDRSLHPAEREWFEDLARRWKEVGPVSTAAKNVFIVCFTQSSDNEELWSRRYAGHHRGYALEFELLNKETLKLPGLGMTWGPIEYDTAQAESRLVQAFSGVMAEWRRCPVRSVSAIRIARRSVWLAGCYSAIFTKSHDYAEEKEWRMAVVAHRGATVIQAHRRYVEVRLRQNLSHPKLRAIHVGRRAPRAAEPRLAKALQLMGYPPIATQRRP